MHSVHNLFKKCLILKITFQFLLFIHEVRNTKKSKIFEKICFTYFSKKTPFKVFLSTVLKTITRSESLAIDMDR